jgi:hypothetical protein
LRVASLGTTDLQQQKRIWVDLQKQLWRDVPFKTSTLVQRSCAGERDGRVSAQKTAKSWRAERATSHLTIIVKV